MPDSGLDTFRHALSVARKHGFTEVSIEAGEQAFEAKLGPVPKRSAATLGVGAEAAVQMEEGLSAITSPIVGYYQAAPQPLAPGSEVSSGDIVAVIAALGLGNDVEAHVTGEVVEVFVTPGQAVEYGQPIASVRPT